MKKIAATQTIVLAGLFMSQFARGEQVDRDCFIESDRLVGDGLYITSIRQNTKPEQIIGVIESVLGESSDKVKFVLSESLFDGQILYFQPLNVAAVKADNKLRAEAIKLMGALAQNPSVEAIECNSIVRAVRSSDR